MLVRRFLGSLGAAVLALVAALTGAVEMPSAAAGPCPDIEVIFARGTGADPGLGFVGDAFVDSLRSKVGGRSVGTYAVNYPAGWNFETSAPAGAADASGRVQWMADNCPNTRLVLGGMSQGAGVIDLITADARPLGRFNPTPLPTHVADHVAAVAVFGNPLRNIKGGGPHLRAQDDRHVRTRRHLLHAGQEPVGTLRLRRQRNDQSGGGFRSGSPPLAGRLSLPGSARVERWSDREFRHRKPYERVGAAVCRAAP